MRVLPLVSALLASFAAFTSASELSSSLLTPVDSELSFKTLSARNPFEVVDNLSESPSLNNLDLLSATGSGSDVSVTCEGVDTTYSFIRASSTDVWTESISSVQLSTSSYSDVGTITVSLSMDESEGYMSITETDGLTLESGSFSKFGDLQFSGSLTDINDALATLAYTCASDFSGIATMSIYTSANNVTSSECSLLISVTFTTQTSVTCRCSYNSTDGFDVSSISSGFYSDLESTTSQDSYRFSGYSGSDKTSQFTINPSRTTGGGGTSVLAKEFMLMAASSGTTLDTPQEIYSYLASLTTEDVSDTTYLKYVDFSSWEMECSDGSWAASCGSGGSGGSNSWKLPVIIVCSVVGGLLLLGLIFFAVRRYRNSTKADEQFNAAVPVKTVEGEASTIGAASTAKQFIYSAPDKDGEGAEYSSSDPKSINYISEIALQEKGSAIDPTQAKDISDEMLFGAPILVGTDEKAAAALAKAQADQTGAEPSVLLHNSTSSKPKASATSTGRHFFYVDENRPDLSSMSGSSIMGREDSRRHSTGSAHFKYGDDNGEESSRSHSLSTSSNFNATNLPQPPSTPVSRQGVDSFKSTSSLDLAKNDYPSRATTVASNSAFNTPETSYRAGSFSVTNSPDVSVNKKLPTKVVRPGSFSSTNSDFAN